MRFLLAATRLWLPLAIGAGGVVAIVLGHARASSPSAATGVGLIIVALIVWMLNWLFRMSIESNREREREEAARDYFSQHGRWPDE
jgi:drug/metabolite transporter (DMT)-like permease